MIMETNNEAWSNRLWRSGKISCLSNSSDSAWRNIRSSTEFESWALFTYYVSTGLIEVNISRPKLSATSQTVSVCTKWYEYDQS